MGVVKGVNDGLLKLDSFNNSLLLFWAGFLSNGFFLCHETFLSLKKNPPHRC